jgi:hypothetical protein
MPVQVMRYPCTLTHTADLQRSAYDDYASTLRAVRAQSSKWTIPYCTASAIYPVPMVPNNELSCEEDLETRSNKRTALGCIRCGQFLEHDVRSAEKRIGRTALIGDDAKEWRVNE